MHVMLLHIIVVKSSDLDTQIFARGIVKLRPTEKSLRRSIARRINIQQLL